MRKREARSQPLAKRLRAELTKAEVVLWTYLRRIERAGDKFRRQHPIGPYVADFAHLKAKLVVELDGATHSTDEELRHDEIRTRYLESRGWNVIRFQNEDVYESVRSVIAAIHEHLPPPSATQTPPP